MKKYRVVYTPLASRKLENILSYITLDSKKVALEIIEGINKQIMSLETMPERFVIVPEITDSKNNFQIRHFFYKKSFRIIYVIEDDIVRIINILHSTQNRISSNLIH